MKKSYGIIEDVIIILLFGLCIIFFPNVSLVLLGVYSSILILMVIYLGYKEEVYLEKEYKGEKNNETHKQRRKRKS